MKHLIVPVLAIQQIAKATYQLDLEIEKSLLAQIKPGQFIHIRVNQGSEFMLRRPISVADIDLALNKLTVIFKVFGKGTDVLTHLKTGELIDLLIPLGNGYPIESIEMEHALLVGGGVGVPPLYYLAKSLVEKGIAVTTVIGFQTKDEIFYQKEFAELGEVFVTTDDGSYGTKGYVTNVLQHEELNFDYYFSCGPAPMLKAVKKYLHYFPGYISLEERMGCGIGACYACVVKSADGKDQKKICTDGPVFNATEVMI